MAEVKISALTLLAQNDVDGTNDELVIVDDTGTGTTKKVKPGALIKGAGGFFADGTTPLSGTLNADDNLIENVILSGNFSGGFGWAEDPNTYIYQPAPDQISFVAGGSERFRLAATSIEFYRDPVPSSDSSRDVGNLSKRWKSGSFLYLNAANNIRSEEGIRADGTGSFSNVSVDSGGHVLLSGSGRLGWSEDPDTYIHRTSFNQIAFVIGNSQRLVINTGGFIFQNKVLPQGGVDIDFGSLVQRWNSGSFKHLNIDGDIEIDGALTGAIDLSGTTLSNGKPLRVSSSLETGTTYTLSDGNHGQILLASASALYTVPNTLTNGTQITVTNYMSGTQFRFTGSGGTDFIYPSDVYKTASAMTPRGSVVVFTAVRAGEVLVTGDLELV